MVFVCPEKSQKRKKLLNELRCLVDKISADIENKSNKCPFATMKPAVKNGVGPVIAIYDPLPKPCVPICNPTPPCGRPCPPVSDGCCPPTVCTPVPVINTTPPQQPICVPQCMPICTAAPPVRCIPICDPNPPEQPCVPCQPPQMMVCYRRSKKKDTTKEPRCKSRELRASILYVCCDCTKLNGLQDNCQRTGCHGSPECLTDPPTCPPSEYAGCKHLGNKKYGTAYGKSKDLEEYQCYPAHVQLPNNCAGDNRQGAIACLSPTNCPPCSPPCVPVFAQVPCPPVMAAPQCSAAGCSMPVCPVPMICCPQPSLCSPCPC